jgi:predicted ATP-grasp superfamily ATP-dependent carboligase
VNIDLKKPLVYVTRDIERALGMEPKGKYFVISNESEYGKEVQKKYPDNILLVKAEKILDTHELMKYPEVEQMINKLEADIVVFLNTPKIERIAEENKWNLINPEAALARKVEEKISQVKWLKEDAKFLPPHKVMVLKEVEFAGKKFVLQFNHSHTGQGTYVIESAEELQALATKFPERECRVVDFINGPVFTINAVVSKEINTGNVSYQITGIPPFTDLPFSTIGNDWELPQAPHYKNAYEDTNKMAAKVGERLFDAGWRGLFGLDVIYDEKKKKTYLLEINARQPASAVYESILQKKENKKGWTVFEAHIAALLGEPLKNLELTTIEGGSQIVKRVTNKKWVVDVQALKDEGFSILTYDNFEHNKELFRIQLDAGIMEGHNMLNSTGLSIYSCIREQ